jgi:hypothetical protein
MGLHPAVRGLEHLYASGTSLRFRPTSHCVHLSLSLLHLPKIISPPVCIYTLPENIFHFRLKRRGWNINQEGPLNLSACLSAFLRCKDFFCFEPFLVSCSPSCCFMWTLKVKQHTTVPGTQELYFLWWRKTWSS